MKNNKGFTLIELLAVIVILAVIMTIAIPNIISTLDKNKKDSFIEDAMRMISSAEYKIRVDKSIDYPNMNDVVVLKLGSLDSSNLEESTYGTFYSKEYSFVAITKESVSNTEYTYKFYAHFVSCKNSECRDDSDLDFNEYNYGINLTSYDVLHGGREKYDTIVSGTDVKVNLINEKAGILTLLGKASTGNVYIY